MWKGELNDDTNWIHGCFNWYPSPGNPKGSSRNVYYNNRPGATSGVYGGHKPCADNPVTRTSETPPDAGRLS